MTGELFVYSKPNCPQCDTLKAQLQNADVPFTEVSATDPVVRAFLLERGHRSVPLMYRGGVHLKNISEV